MTRTEVITKPSSLLAPAQGNDLETYFDLIRWLLQVNQVKR